MIWTLKIECVRGRYLERPWVRVVELDSGSTLEDVHQLIQKMIRFDRDHLYEFFASRQSRGRRLMLVGEDELEMEAWDDFALDQLFPLPKNHRLYYHFDFGDDWYFQITKLRRKETTPEKGVRYPRIIDQEGRNPPQYGR